MKMTPRRPGRLHKVAVSATWKDAVADFIASLDNGKRSRHTRHHYRDDLDAFERWWDEANPQERLMPSAVTEEDVAEWQQWLKDEPLNSAGWTRERWKRPLPSGAVRGPFEPSPRRRKPAAVNAKLAALKSFLAWCHRKGMIPVPVAPPRPEKLGARAVKWLDEKEQRQLLRQAARDRNKRTLPMIRVFLETGLRLAELVALQRADVEVSERKGKVEVREGKGRKPRTIPLSQDARSAFEALFDLNPDAGPADPVFTSQRKDPETGRGKPLSARGVQEVMDRLNSSLGWPELHPHLLRHSFAMNLRRDGVDWPVIARLMGHSSIATTMQHYGTPSEKDLAAAVNRSRRVVDND